MFGGFSTTKGFPGERGRLNDEGPHTRWAIKDSGRLYGPLIELPAVG